MIFKSKKRKIFHINIGNFLSFSLEKEFEMVPPSSKASHLLEGGTIILIKPHG